MLRAPTETHRDDISTTLKRALAAGAHRYRKVRRLWKESGKQGVLHRLRHGVAQRLAPTTATMPVRPADVVAAGLAAQRKWPLLPIDGSRPLVVNWVIEPPSAGAGELTTILRLLEHFEKAGHVCRGPLRCLWR